MCIGLDTFDLVPNLCAVLVTSSRAWSVVSSRRLKPRCNGKGAYEAHRRTARGLLRGGHPADDSVITRIGPLPRIRPVRPEQSAPHARRPSTARPTPRRWPLNPYLLSIVRARAPIQLPIPSQSSSRPLLTSPRRPCPVAPQAADTAPSKVSQPAMAVRLPQPSPAAVSPETWRGPAPPLRATAGRAQTWWMSPRLGPPLKGFSGWGRRV